MHAKYPLNKSGPEHVFDFPFEKFSTETAAPRVTSAAPAPAPAAPAAEPGAAPAPAAPAPAEAPVVEIAPAADPGLIAMPIPETVPEMLAQLRTRDEQIRSFIDRGSFGSVYVPAFQAKDLALALDEHRDKVSAERRRSVGPAVAQLVRSAYLLDAFGDLGNKQQILDAYALFAAAVKAIEASFPER